MSATLQFEYQVNHNNKNKEKANYIHISHGELRLALWTNSLRCLNSLELSQKLPVNHSKNKTLNSTTNLNFVYFQLLYVQFKYNTFLFRYVKTFAHSKQLMSASLCTL